MSTVALVYTGPINHPATTRLRNAICMVANERVPNAQNQSIRKYDKMFLLLDSVGGSIDDGFSLYGLLRTISDDLKIEVTTVNMGLVASIANVVFLAGDHRIALPGSLFHFHNFEWTVGQAQTLTRDKFEDLTNILDSSRAEKLALLKSRTSLTDADFEALKLLDSPIVRDAAFAQSKGIVQKVGMPGLPTDSIVLNVDY